MLSQRRKRNQSLRDGHWIVGEIRWDEKTRLRRDAVRSQVIDALEAQEIKETGNEGDQHCSGKGVALSRYAFKKVPDAPLGEVLKRKLKHRADGATGRKSR
jgi:hypothetical protein